MTDFVKLALGIIILCGGLAIHEMRIRDLEKKVNHEESRED